MLVAGLKLALVACLKLTSEQLAQIWHKWYYVLQAAEQIPNSKMLSELNLT